MKNFYYTIKQLVLNISDKEIISEAQKYLNSPIIHSHKTPNELTDKIVSIAKNCLKDSEKIHYICKNIKETLESEFIELWGCNAFYDNRENCCITYSTSFLVWINFGRLSIIVFKIYDKVFFEVNLKKISQFYYKNPIYLFIFLKRLIYLNWVRS
jgi:hypothetical protein